MLEGARELGTVDIYYHYHYHYYYHYHYHYHYHYFVKGIYHTANTTLDHCGCLIDFSILRYILEVVSHVRFLEYLEIGLVTRFRLL